MAKDEVGNRYNRLVVLRKDTESKTKSGKWICRCDCGTESSFRITMLRANRTKSCGCLRLELLADNRANNAGRRKKGAVTGHPLYERWRSIRSRAMKGGSIFHPEWKKFNNFLKDVGEPPNLDYSKWFWNLKDDSLGWVPGNVFWGVTMRTKPSVPYDPARAKLRSGFGPTWSDEEIIDFINEFIDYEEDENEFVPPIRVKWKSNYVRF